MILGSKARYAVMAMVELAARREAGPISLSELAEKQEIPLSYLEQIFARLRKSGLVDSARGPGGGYTLAKTAADINIAEIVIAADESLKMTRCENHSENGCLAKKARCNTHHLWEGLEDHISSYLQNISLASLIPQPTNHIFNINTCLPESKKLN